MGSALTISEVSKLHGENIAESWLEIQLRDLNEFVGVQNKMSVEQIQSLSQSIFYYYPGFKVTEFILFFQMFKMGEFGQFFGSVDSLVLTNALKSFFEYRNGRINHFEATQRSVKRENELKQMQKDQKEGKTMTYSEYKEIEWLFNM